MMDRAQANLLALAVSLLVLTMTVGTALVLVEGVFQNADRESREQRIAVTLSDRLTGDPALTSRENVINETRIRNLTPARLDRAYPIARGTDIRIRLGNETIFERGDPTGGTTVRRLVLGERPQPVTRSFSNGTIVVSNASSRATVALNGSTRTVRVNGRVVRHDPNGLGEVEVSLPRTGSTRIRIEPAGPTSNREPTVTYHTIRTSATQLEVTIDA